MTDQLSETDHLKLQLLQSKLSEAKAELQLAKNEWDHYLQTLRAKYQLQGADKLLLSGKIVRQPAGFASAEILREPGLGDSLAQAKMQQQLEANKVLAANQEH